MSDGAVVDDMAWPTAVLVVVPAHDEAGYIATCLVSIARARACLALSRPGVHVSVTVVLDSCRDDTAGAVEHHGRVSTLVVDHRSVGAARRAGVCDAVSALAPEHDPAGVLVVNTDADCVVPSTWLADHVRLAADHDLVLGEVEPDPRDLTPAALDRWWAAHPVGRGSLHGANLSVRLDAYLRAGGFAAVTHREDALLVRALRAQGARVVGGTRVVTSGRRVGRAPGGFADYLVAMDADAGLVS